MAKDKDIYSGKLCELCDKMFNLQEFFSHLITFHYYAELCQFLAIDPNPHPFGITQICSKCQKRFIFKKNLLIHYFNTHGLTHLVEVHKRNLDVLQKSCQICNETIKGSTSNVLFKQHIIKTHYGQVLEDLKDLKAIKYPWMCVCMVKLSNFEKVLKHLSDFHKLFQDLYEKEVRNTEQDRITCTFCHFTQKFYSQFMYQFILDQLK